MKEEAMNYNIMELEDLKEKSFQDFSYRVEEDVAVINFNMKVSKVNTLNSRLIPQF